MKIAADGEILTRGPARHEGLLQQARGDARSRSTPTAGSTPATSASCATASSRITDRKKDIIVTAGGKNIAPQPIENKVKTNKYVSQAVMIGDKRKFPSMLDRAELRPAREVGEAAQHHLDRSRAAAARCRRSRRRWRRKCIEELAGLAHFEMPKKIGLLEHDFSIERGELTPTLKVKRRVIDKNYKALIDSLYDEAERSGITDSHAIV